jgi:hypothetical protein
MALARTLLEANFPTQPTDRRGHIRVVDVAVAGSGRPHAEVHEGYHRNE